MCLASVDQLVCPGAWHPGSGSSPAGANLLAGGGVVYLHVEKKISCHPTPKHRFKAGPASQPLWCCCLGGAGFEDFLDLSEEVFFLQHNAVGRSCFMNDKCSETKVYISIFQYTIIQHQMVFLSFTL